MRHRDQLLHLHDVLHTYSYTHARGLLITPTDRIVLLLCVVMGKSLPSACRTWHQPPPQTASAYPSAAYLIGSIHTQIDYVHHTHTHTHDIYIYRSTNTTNDDVRSLVTLPPPPLLSSNTFSSLYTHLCTTPETPFHYSRSQTQVSIRTLACVWYQHYMRQLSSKLNFEVTMFLMFR